MYSCVHRSTPPRLALGPWTGTAYHASITLTQNGIGFYFSHRTSFFRVPEVYDLPLLRESVADILLMILSYFYDNCCWYFHIFTYMSIIGLNKLIYVLLICSLAELSIDLLYIQIHLPIFLHLTFKQKGWCCKWFVNIQIFGKEPK